MNERKELPVRLTPAIADAFMLLRQGPMTIKRRVTEFWGGYCWMAKVDRVYRINGRSVYERTWYKLRATALVEGDAISEVGTRVYIGRGGIVEVCATVGEAQRRFDADRDLAIQKQEQRFRKSFPKVYLTPSTGTLYVCRTYEEWLGYPKMWDPETQEPMIQIPPPRDMGELYTPKYISWPRGEA